jgi:exopolysaccharide production protein ExoQ
VTYLATLGCLIFIFYLFIEDGRDEVDSAGGLWIPLVWMFFAGSRWLSAWLDLQPPLDSADAYSEGSPIDRAVFLALIIAGIAVLRRRRIDWFALFSSNKLLALYLLYCLVSVCWSDVPFIAFKRWGKDLGNPIMVLVILTTPDPTQALAQTLRRLAFLVLPLSVLFVRYYPATRRMTWG